MIKKSLFLVLGIAVLTITIIMGHQISAEAMIINYVNGPADLAQAPIFGTMIDPSGYYYTDSGDPKTAGNSLDNTRVYTWDYGYISGTPDSPFVMLKWDMGFATDFVRVYPDIENGFQSDGHDYLEWSLWGSNNPGESSANWTLLWDPIASTGVSYLDLMVTQVAGVAESVTIYRETNPSVGLVPASGYGDSFTMDFTLQDSYRYVGIRASTKDTASWDPDPEINAVATKSVPEPGFILLFGTGLIALVGLSLKRTL